MLQLFQVTFAFLTIISYSLSFVYLISQGLRKFSKIEESIILVILVKTILHIDWENIDLKIVLLYRDEPVQRFSSKSARNPICRALKDFHC